MSNNFNKNIINSDQEFINYLNTENIMSNNSSVDQINNFNQNNPLNGNLNNVNKKKYQNNVDPNKEEKLEIEFKNVQMLILQRSLYILKKKFEINKKELEIIYQKI